MPQLGVTINIISLFGFILVLGIVVDDAIVTGRIFTAIFRGKSSNSGSHPGGPGSLRFRDLWCSDHCGSLCSDHDDRGLRGKIFAQIPLVVIPALLFSPVESKLILPAHLKHLRMHSNPEGSGSLRTVFNNSLLAASNALPRVFTLQPTLRLAMQYRYMTLAGFTGICLILFTLLASNRMMFRSSPRGPPNASLFG